LRGFIAALERRALLTRVSDRVAWRHQIGDIARTVRMPVLFENIEDYPGRKLFTNGLVRPETLALALGIDGQTGMRGIARCVARRISQPLLPVIVDDAPVKENVVTGDDVDLRLLPIPWWSPNDGGRYLGTWHINVSRDPETGNRNAGVYRMMLLDRNTATLSVYKDSHLARHLKSAERLGRPLEMALAIGVDERLIIAAAASPPYGVDEYTLAGALAEAPLRVTPCAVVHEQVPADAEIVIEGLIEPGVTVSDGPFFDYTGVVNTNPQARLFRVKAVMYRSDYIFRGTAVGMPGAEDHILYTLLAHLGLSDFHGSRVKRRLQNALLKRGMYRLYQSVGKVRR
jgi:UbiD family decarboxylase